MNEMVDEFINGLISRGATCLFERELEDTRGVIRIRTSKKNRQHNGQMKSTKDKQRSTKHIYKTKDRVTQIACTKNRG
jgi:hypothetical protein